MHLQAFVVFSLSIVQTFLCYEKVEASDDPILEYLGMESDSVSEHELVEIDLSERLHKRGLRDGKSMSFRAFGDKIDLWLRPVDRTFISARNPVWEAKFEEGPPARVVYHKVPGALSNITRILQDPKHLASVMLDSDDSGKTTVTAYLRSPKDHSHLTIRPLPTNVIREYMRKKRSIDDLNDDFTDSTYHVVLKLSSDKFKNHTMDVLRSAQAENSSNTHSPQVSSDEDVRNLTETGILYPEILVQTDFSYAVNLTVDDLNNHLKYLLIFWNSVNLVYRQVETPKIRLHVGGIIFATHRNSTPFIARFQNKDNSFNSTAAYWGSLGYYILSMKKFPFYDYDLVATMTKWPMGNTTEYLTLGVSHRFGLCPHKSSALIRDNGAFSGIAPAAHELGHTFGLDEDDIETGTECSWTHGYLMSPELSTTKNGMTFSPCSLRALEANFTIANFKCLANDTFKILSVAEQVPVMLPGKFRSLAEQCAAEGGKEPCDKDDPTVDICVRKHCKKTVNGKEGCYPFQPAIPGTACTRKEDSKAGICLDYRCVNES